ncbi:MAG TPA: T9SS type A sorting domain-containing protein, partial [Saprospiraceae bacterium]|nr:T9SS type A sorting domain-containing protein [Saprospiraceae bacterium]
RNNIIYIDNLVSVECNIGPNTAPETFTFSNNFWYHSEDSNWPGPDLPVEDTDNIVGEDPQFVDDGAEDFNLMQGSAAVGVGYVVVDPTEDYNGDEFLNPRSVGAFEGGVTTAIHIPIETSVPKTNIWPNPTNTMINIDVSTQLDGLSISLISLTGVEVFNQNDVKLSDKNRYTISPDKTFQGLYILKISGAEFQESHLVYISD